jgi:hypothetical protein
MLLRTWRHLTLLLAALALTMTSAHVLELPQKMTLDLPFYAAVNGTLYRWCRGSVRRRATVASLGGRTLRTDSCRIVTVPLGAPEDLETCRASVHDTATVPAPRALL